MSAFGGKAEIPSSCLDGRLWLLGLGRARETAGIYRSPEWHCSVAGRCGRAEGPNRKTVKSTSAVSEGHCYVCHLHTVRCTAHMQIGRGGYQPERLVQRI